MISDTAFTSPWSPEVLLSQDFRLPVIEDDEDSNSILECQEKEILCYTYSSGTSIASSECSSDDLHNDDDEVFLQNVHLSSCLLAGLETSDISESLSLDGLDWTDPSSFVSSSNYSLDNDWYPDPVVPEASQAFTCSPVTSKQCRCRHRRKGNKKWSKMTRDERLETVEELSSTVTNNLGLREQLEVIRIINPLADTSTTESEFYIDLEVIDDNKLQKIENIVNFNSSQSPEPDHLCRNTYESSKKFSKKTKQDRRPSQRVPKNRLKKENRQKLKERRSGLFVKEERLAVSTIRNSEIDEDIDILG